MHTETIHLIDNTLKSSASSENIKVILKNKGKEGIKLYLLGDSEQFLPMLHKIEN